MSDLVIVEIQLIVEFVLDREGIVVTKYAERPMQGFALQSNSVLGECLIKSLTLARVWKADGSRRRDLVTFCLMSPKDAKRFAGGDEVFLKNVEVRGVLRE
jgi:hypothetical protein